MVKVENSGVLRELAGRFMESSRRRDRIALLAVILTCLLFTTLFTGTVSVILTKREADIKTFRVSSHAFAQDLTAGGYERAVRALEESEDVETFGTGIFLGSGIDDRFGFSAEVRYGDEKTAESFCSVPTTGRMPEKKDEIAVGTIVLDALGLPHALGTEMTLTYENGPSGTGERTDTFRLCGYWESDRGVVGQMIWVSGDYAKEERYGLTERDLEEGVRNGGYDLVVWYKDQLFLSKKTETLAKKSDAAFEVNPAYDLMGEDGFSFGTVAVIVFLIVLAGYLIIYNIFSISVKGDLQVYGLLKNIGATGKQLKKIVYMQAVRLAAIGIPLGLLGGYLAGRAMAPSLNVDLDRAAEGGGSVQAVVSADPMIFVAAAALTAVTVYLSVMQPCRLVGRVSPVEALRMAEDERSYKKMRKAGGSGGWPVMAMQNVCGNLRKGCVVMLSIALSLAVMDCTVMLVEGYDIASYKKAVLAADFKLDQMGATSQDAKFDGITPSIKRQLEDLPAGRTGYVYCHGGSLKMGADFKEKWKNWAAYYEESWGRYEKELWAQTYEKGRLPVHYMGISRAVFERLEWTGESCSWEEFCQEGHALVDHGARYGEHPFSYHQTGSEIRIKLKDGPKKSYTVMGTAKLPYPMDYPYTDLYAVTVIVPEQGFIKSTGSGGAMLAVIDCSRDERVSIKKYLEDTVLRENSQVHMVSSLDLDASFRKILERYYVIGGVLVAVLFFIGIMNFFNAVAASVISRKRELALLEAVGMTRSQIVKMLAAEGCIYLAGAEAIALGIVCTCAEGLLERTLGRAFFFQAHLVVWPCLAPLPVLFLIVYGISRRQFYEMGQESVVERLRDL